MQRCLVPPSLFDGEACRLPPEVSRHLRTVLRVRVGDGLWLIDGEGRMRPARIAGIGRDAVDCEACGAIETLPRPTPEIALYQCVAKGARMDWLVEKAVEMGAARLVPVLSHNTVVKLPEGERVARWDRIADSALEQCGGTWRLRIDPVHSWVRAVAEIRKEHSAFVAALAPGAVPVSQALEPWSSRKADSAAWIVGPEGDFTGEELHALLDAGATPVSLGARILRTETAALFGLCALRSRTL